MEERNTPEHGEDLCGAFLLAGGHDRVVDASADTVFKALMDDRVPALTGAVSRLPAELSCTGRGTVPFRNIPHEHPAVLY